MFLLNLRNMGKKKRKELSEEELAKLAEKKKAREERKKLWKAELEEASDTMIYRHKAKNVYTVYCPVCDVRFEGSEYLKTVFEDDRELWLANMVMHHRHEHITSWNKCWGYGGWYYRQAAHFGTYEEEKAKVNERAKREIARKCKEYILKNNVNPSIFNKLQNTTQETLNVVEKIFEKKNKGDKKNKDK